ncbi:PKD domain-containing protein [Conexibacter sp. CPCC 206217]|uniref:PKD domain-containing protein n=1 Tax=Conexibacter sp. CPCC 206217 TaxID=3064574 RepID=UPI00271D0FD2|nr:PKD domain-containing protein [Conexibacter sp. CPCC 206217]MDO8209322.1 PKD domain-containing protein [Conexibacter sp. CPCC 206217]
MLAATAAAGNSAGAGAVVLPSQTLDGPNATILDVGGAALAPDGTGGVVYRKLVDGTPHVFVARFAHGSWSAPIRVDTGQSFAATFPTIAAGNRGRLLVVWATPWAVRRDRKTHFALMSATLDPGARGFGQAIEIDPDDIGDGSAAYPSLAMAPGGAAYVAYRVVTNPLDADQGASLGTMPMRPGDELVDVRVARFNGLTWSSLGEVNRLDDQVTMRRPSATNAPSIGVNRAGNAAVVTWQEPSSDGVARIWSRRIFGTTPGNVLAVSPTTLDGSPVDVDADAPALAVSQLSQAKVAFRLLGGSGSVAGGSQLFLSDLPALIEDTAQRFGVAERIETAASIGRPSVSVDADSGYRLVYSADSAVRLVTGDIDGRQPPAPLPGGNGDLPFATLNPEGGGVTAWPSLDDGGRPVVKVRQDFPAGEWQLAALTAPVSGAVDGLATGESERGDGLVAFRQGSAEQSQVVAAIATSRPASFLATTPNRWVRAKAARVRWDAALTSARGITYTVTLDGQTKARGLTARRFRFDPRGLGDGRHDVQVTAVDSDGQETASALAQLRVDSNPPQVTVRRAGRRAVAVVVRDTASGLRRASTRISFGDRTRAAGGRASARHRYRRPGHYVVTVRRRDRIGNAGTWRTRVQVR